MYTVYTCKCMVIYLPKILQKYRMYTVYTCKCMVLANPMYVPHRLRQGTTLDVLGYVGLPSKDRLRVEEYFQYIMHYSHPASEGIAFLNELPKPLFEEVTGAGVCLWHKRFGCFQGYCVPDRAA